MFGVDAVDFRECNEAMANHPTVQVQSYNGLSVVGFLGLLNGLVGAKDNEPRKGWGLITVVVEQDGTVSKFRRTE